MPWQNSGGTVRVEILSDDWLPTGNTMDVDPICGRDFCERCLGCVVCGKGGNGREEYCDIKGHVWVIHPSNLAAFLRSHNMSIMMPPSAPRPEVPGHGGTSGPLYGEYSKPHAYARDVFASSGGCVCGRPLGAELHTEAAPGVPIPEELRVE
jgi:hypothetical protein